jgi:hypothetical protein
MTQFPGQLVLPQVPVTLANSGKQLKVAAVHKPFLSTTVQSAFPEHPWKGSSLEMGPRRKAASSISWSILSALKLLKSGDSGRGMRSEELLMITSMFG